MNGKENPTKATRFKHASVSLRCLLTGGAALTAAAGEWSEDFSSPPERAGWSAFGEADLFHWDESGEALQVTWDSSRSNSYYLRALGTMLSRADDFSASFDVTLDEVQAGLDPEKPFTFELAVGFHRQADAVTPGFRRGTGNGSPNLVEIAWFPDTGYGPTLWPTVIASNGRFNYSGSTDFTLLDLPVGRRHTLTMSFTAADATLRTSVRVDGAEAGPVKAVKLAATFTDFRVDTFAIRSYSDEGAGGSLRAKGWIDNIHVSLPPPPVDRIQLEPAGKGWATRCRVRAGWTAWLERSEDLAAWQEIGLPVAGEGTEVVLPDLLPPVGPAFYRVRADKP